MVKDGSSKLEQSAPDFPRCLGAVSAKLEVVPGELVFSVMKTLPMFSKYIITFILF